MDLYQFHQVKSPAHWKTIVEGGALEFLVKLKAEGRIRHIGASAHSKEGALCVLDDPNIETIQYPFSFLVAEDAQEIVRKSRDKRIGFIAMKSMGGGMIEDAPLALRFLLEHHDIAADPGFEKLTEIDELVATAEEARLLDEADRRHIDEIRGKLGKTFCHRCGYCKPCEEGVNTEMMMVLDSMLRRFPPEKVFSGSIEKLALDSLKCSECGLCEPRCPYVLPIRKRMKENYAVWEKAKAQWERSKSVGAS